MQKGIFWMLPEDGGTVLKISVPCNAAGESLDPAVCFSSKSGESFNHKAEWERLGRRVTNGLPFDHYPRGRVEVKNGRVTIFLNPSLCETAALQRILAAFDLTASQNVRIVADGSKHYYFKG